MTIQEMHDLIGYRKVVAVWTYLIQATERPVEVFAFIDKAEEQTRTSSLPFEVIDEAYADARDRYLFYRDPNTYGKNGYERDMGEPI